MRNVLGLGGTYRIIRERIVRVHWIMHLYFVFKSIYLVMGSIGILKLMDCTSPYRFSSSIGSICCIQGSQVQFNFVSLFFCYSTLAMFQSIKGITTGQRQGYTTSYNGRSLFKLSAEDFSSPSFLSLFTVVRGMKIAVFYACSLKVP